MPYHEFSQPGQNYTFFLESELACGVDVPKNRDLSYARSDGIACGMAGRRIIKITYMRP